MTEITAIDLDEEPDPHEAVLMEALAIWHERQGRYADLWSEHGVRGNLVKLRWKVDRVWRGLWHSEDVRSAGVDDALDAINYAVCVIRAARAGDRDGRWNW